MLPKWLQVLLQPNHIPQGVYDVLSWVTQVISFSIVTAHKFFVLHNNHPLNHDQQQSFAQVQNGRRDTLFLSGLTKLCSCGGTHVLRMSTYFLSSSGGRKANHFSMVWIEARPTSAHWLGHMLPQRWGHYHVLQDHGSILPQSSGQCSPCCAANGRIEATKGAWCCLRGFVNTVSGSHSKRQAQKCKHHATHSDWTHAVGAKVWKSVSMWRQCHFVDVDEAVWDWWSADELTWSSWGVPYYIYMYIRIQPGLLMGRNMGSVWSGQTFLEVLEISL